MGRFWVIELSDDLAAQRTTRTGVWCGVKGVNGVRSVTDLEAISCETLDEMLRSSECKRVFRPAGGWRWEHAPGCVLDIRKRVRVK